MKIHMYKCKQSIITLIGRLKMGGYILNAALSENANLGEA